MGQHPFPPTHPARPPPPRGCWRPLRPALAWAGFLWAIGAVHAMPAGEALELDTERSSLEVQIQSSLTSFHGTMPRFQADIRVDREHQQLLRAEVHFAFADLKTGIALRDRHMREWQDTDRYPD